ncbi:hypothetical protein [Klebsiella variicola]
MTRYMTHAWFMYAALGTREMWTGYFRYPDDLLQRALQ